MPESNNKDNLVVGVDLGGTKILAGVFDHSLEFVNPRRSVGFSPVAQKAIRYGMPERLNPRLQSVLTSSAYGLRLKLQGLPALLREAKRFANRKAEIVSFNDEFRLRIYGSF